MLNLIVFNVGDFRIQFLIVSNKSSDKKIIKFNRDSPVEVSNPFH